jgi:hypothetical protein
MANPQSIMRVVHWAKLLVVASSWMTPMPDASMIKDDISTSLIMILNGDESVTEGEVIF